MIQISKRSILKKAALTASSLVFCIVLLEILLRVFAPVYPTGGMSQAYTYDHELGYRLRPGVHLFRTTDFQQEIQVNGIGTTNFQTDFDGYPALVFALGDSFTHGIGVPADQAYPAQLDMLLNADQNGYYVKQYGVVNLGAAGYGGEQSLLALDHWSSVIRVPNVIIYLGCDNDFADDQEFKNGRRHQIAVAESPYWGRWVPLVQWYNDLQVRLRWKMVSARYKELRASLDLATPAMAADPVAPASIAELEAPVLERLLQYSKAHHARLIVGWSGGGPSYEFSKSWAAKNGVGFADWEPKVKSVETAIPALPRENQHSNRHYRGWVNHLLASEFARQIRAGR
jgi:hypothetical protein